MTDCLVTIANNDTSFAIPRSEIILDGALAQGIALPHQCRGASCGTCKAQVLEGRVDHGWSLGFAITDEEKEQGMCLACQARPMSDTLVIRMLQPMPAAPQGPVSRTTGHVVASTRLTPRVQRLVLSVDGGLAYAAGAYAELVLPGVDGVRQYSFAGAPAGDGLLEFFVARHPGGQASGYIHDTLAVGDRVEVIGPFGTCRLPEGSGPVLGLAGGTGLAPVLSIFEDALHKGCRDPLRLVLSVREDAEVFALDRLHRLAALYPNFSHDVLVTDAPSRLGGKQQLAPQWIREHYTDMSGVRAVIGGSPGFVDACSAACQSLGLPQARLSTDSFLPAVRT